MTTRTALVAIAWQLLASSAFADEETTTSDAVTTEIAAEPTGSEDPASAEVTPAPSTEAPPAADPPMADTRTSVYFVGLTERDIDPTRARVVEDLVLAALLARSDLKVVSDKTIADALEQASTLQQDDCFAESEACVREVALVLGTRTVLTGSVATVDDTIVIELVLVDTKDGIPLGRERLDVRTTESLQRRIAPTIANLFAPLTGASVVVVDAEPAPRRFDDLSVLLPLAIAGGVSGLFVFVAATTSVSLQVANLVDPQYLFWWLVPALGSTLTAPLVGALFFGGATVASDLVDDDVDLLRTLGIAACGALILTTTIPFVAGSTAAASVASYVLISIAIGKPAGSFDFEPAYTLPVIASGAAFAAVASTASAVLLTGVALGVFALATPTPSFGEE